MARTIEIASIHKGTIAFHTKGESRSVKFEDKGDVGLAMVDNDEAEVFLTIGLPDYWKPGGITVKADKADKADKAEKAEKADTDAGKADTGKRKAADVISDITTAETAEAVDAIAAGDARATVVAAVEARKAELNPTA